tara:strand:- start:35 stop:466 length:432 start_codon:yes stop_codon:yes gene_type:complete
MEHLLIICIFIILLIFLNKRFKKIEGYTNCIREPSTRLFSFHFNQRFNELSILRNIDLGNRAYKLNIPLNEIKELIHKDKEKLIFKIMLKEETIFDLKKELKSRKKQLETGGKSSGTPSKIFKPLTYQRNIMGFNMDTIGKYP